MTQMTPAEIVRELDHFIIGQQKAKRAVAIALRNRWRRMQLEPALRQEISPKNILMIGPTGVGKTEIARRLAKLAQAPFIKVEATKFTEVGYVGKEVDSIIRDLADVAFNLVKEEQLSTILPKAKELTEERILDELLPPTYTDWGRLEKPELPQGETPSGLRELFRKKLRAGSLDDREIEIAFNSGPLGVEILSPVGPGIEEMTNQLQSLFQNLSTRRQKKRRVLVSEAFKLFLEEESSKLINPEELKQKTIEAVEQNGIVFIDEIDKLSRRADSHASGADISREGVQRDLLPLVEGCTVSTKHGMVKTDHILFIASGAFQVSSPSDLIPELQGRLPIRVELSALNIEDFERILTEPNASLTEQYQALLGTEGIRIQFTENGIKKIAEAAWQVNDQTENIGARRLYTLLERLMEDISFQANVQEEQIISIDAGYVQTHLEDLIKDQDLSRFIL